MTMTKELVEWSYEKRCQKAVESLARNGFTAVYCPSGREAAEYIVAEAAEAATIGFGGSLSVADLGVAASMKEMGKELLMHSAPGLSPDERRSVMRRQLTCDLFLAGTNAVTLNGWLVNIDGNGNRVAALTFGPKKVLVVAGGQKVVADVPDAIRRIKSTVAPRKIATRLKLTTANAGCSSSASLS